MTNQIENAIKWLEGLKSGEYKQAFGVLGNEKKGFCCWGLACFITNKTYKPTAGWDFALYLQIGFLNSQGFIIPDYIDEGGVSHSSLPMLNDVAKWSFDQIADYLIKHADTNFVPEVAKAIIEHFKTEDPRS